MRTRPIVTCLLLLALALSAANPGGKVKYIGGTVGELGERPNGRLVTTGDSHLVYESGPLLYVIPWSQINLIEYGQQVSRRYGLAIAISPLLALSKSRKHFLTVGFLDRSDNQQALVFRVDKNDIRMLLVSLEAKTDLLVEYQDEEARQAGKGN